VHWFQRIAGLTLIAQSASAFGLAAEGVAGGVEYSVYAPDWTWQGRDANVMAVLENTSNSEISCHLSLVIPENVVDHFGRNGAPFAADSTPFTTEVTVPPGETRRVALTGLTALHGHPLQTYQLQVTIQADDDAALIPYPLQTIRGQAVSEGRAVALGVPIGVALLFSAAFALVLRTTAGPHAWKVAGPTAEEPAEPEPWIATTPK
jgi:hypothetical protein